MSGPSNVVEQVIQNKQEIIDFHAKGNKPESAWQLVPSMKNFSSVSMIYAHQRMKAIAVLTMLRGLTRFGWTPYEENGKVIALLRDGASVTLEPAGQLELSGAKNAQANVHETCCEVANHLYEVKSVADGHLGFLGMGFPTEMVA